MKLIFIINYTIEQEVCQEWGRCLGFYGISFSFLEEEKSHNVWHGLQAVSKKE
jgi:hypothetical protein